MTLEQIKSELNAGNKVYSQSLLYEVVYNSNVDDYYIVCSANKSKIGLYWIDGSGKTQLSGTDFFVVKPIPTAEEIIQATEDLSFEDGNKYIESLNLNLVLVQNTFFMREWQVIGNDEFSSITNYKKSNIFNSKSDIHFRFYYYGI